MNKKIGIICLLDGFANSVRPENVSAFLKKNNYEVELINVIKITNILKLESITTKISSIPLLILTSGISFINVLLLRFQWYKRYFFYYILLSQMKIRAKLLFLLLQEKKYHSIIVETSYDSFVLTYDLENTIKIYDSPAPWAYELYGLKFFTETQFEHFKQFEKHIYAAADHLCFQWYLYRQFVEKRLYSGSNLFDLNYGCVPKEKKELAVFSNTPRILYLGYLAGEWINLPLLSHLSELYPYLDVYGGPTPDPKYKLRYKGYAPDTSVINQYQFGLITITKDEYRRYGFASKHLEYISYGVPVFVPNWRKDEILDKSSIYYDETNFLEQIKVYSDQKKWLKKQEASIYLANKLTWDSALKKLIPLLQS